MIRQEDETGGDGLVGLGWVGVAGVGSKAGKKICHRQNKISRQHDLDGKMKNDHRMEERPRGRTARGGSGWVGVGRGDRSNKKDAFLLGAKSMEEPRKAKNTNRPPQF